MKINTARVMVTLSAAAALGFGANATAGSTDMGDFTFTYGGYVKLDAMYSDYSDGNPADGSIGRDFYVPSTTPVGGDSQDGIFDMHAKQTRFYLATKGNYDGHELGGRIEMDFLLSPGGNERVSNSYNPRLRHAFITYDKWLFGQTWSTFQNVGALPDTLDFIGPAEATIFQRQAQIRYTSGAFAIALENNDTTIYPGANAGRISTEAGSVPDLTGRYTFSGDWGNFVIAGLVRQLKSEQLYDPDGAGPAPPVDIDDDLVGYGVSVSGKFNLFARDDFKWMASYGSAMGRYIGLNFAAGAAADANGDLEEIDSWGAFGAYRHWWNDKYRSTIQAGYLDVDNPSEAGNVVGKKAWNASVNLIYQPVAKFFFGGEVKFAEREIESGEDGDFVRFQFSARYNF
jgi:hypothetical protein